MILKFIFYSVIKVRLSSSFLRYPSHRPGCLSDPLAFLCAVLDKLTNEHFSLYVWGGGGRIGFPVPNSDITCCIDVS